MKATVKRLIANFRRSEDGAFTIEAVLWMPIFVALLVLIADASMLFGRKADVLRVIQDANRAMSIGRLREVADAEEYVTDRIGSFAPNAEIAITILDGVVRTVVTIPAGDLTSGVSGGVFNALTVRVSAEHMLEA